MAGPRSRPKTILLVSADLRWRGCRSKELAKRGVLVTRLSAAEDAATMDVLCVDKTASSR